MVNPLQITFRGMAPSAALTAAIEARAARLDRFHPRITTGHVVFEQLHHHHQHGNLFEARLELTVPGGVIRVGHERHDRHAHEDPYVVVRDTFDAARRQLEDFVRQHDHRA